MKAVIQPRTKEYSIPTQFLFIILSSASQIPVSQALVSVALILKTNAKEFEAEEKSTFLQIVNEIVNSDEKDSFPRTNLTENFFECLYQIMIDFKISLSEEEKKDISLLLSYKDQKISQIKIINSKDLYITIKYAFKVDHVISIQT